MLEVAVGVDPDTGPAKCYSKASIDTTSDPKRAVQPEASSDYIRSKAGCPFFPHLIRKNNLAFCKTDGKTYTGFQVGTTHEMFSIV